LGGGVLVKIISDCPGTVEGANVIGCVSEGVLTGWTFGDALPREVIGVNVRIGAVGLVNTQSGEGISVLGGL
jgi:hypothetical protein